MVFDRTSLSRSVVVFEELHRGVELARRLVIDVGPFTRLTPWRSSELVQKALQLLLLLGGQAVVEVPLMLGVKVGE